MSIRILRQKLQALREKHILELNALAQELSKMETDEVSFQRPESWVGYLASNNLRKTSKSKSRAVNR